MKEEPCKHVEGVDTGKRIRKNLLNIGVFITEILILVLLGPWAVRFFLPLLVGWLIAQIANPLVRFLEQHLHIVTKHSSIGNYCRCDPVDCVDLLFDSDMDGRTGSFSAGTFAGILSVAVS